MNINKNWIEESIKYMKKEKDMNVYNKEIGKIFITNDYTKFSFFDFNRKPSLRSNLLKDIKEKGQMQPILVNEKFQIRDGQHRFVALIELNLPIMYMFSTQREDDVAVRSMNSTAKNWNPINYLNSFCSQDKKHYQEFRQMIKLMGLTPNCVYKILRGKELGGSDLESFKSGDFVLSNDEREKFKILLPMFKQLVSIDKYSKDAFSRTKVVNGASEAFLTPNFNFKKLLKIVSKDTAGFYDTARDRATADSFKRFLFRTVGMKLED